MNIVLDVIKSQISPFVDGEKRQQLSALSSLDKVEGFIERHLDENSVFEIQENLLTHFEKSHRNSLQKNEVVTEMPLFDSLDKPDYSGINEAELPTLGRLNEALHDFEHYVTSNLFQVVETQKRNIEKQTGDWDVISKYEDLISNSSEFSRLKRVYVMSIHDSIEYPTRTGSSVRKVNRVLGQAKEAIDSINSLRIEKELREA